MPTFETLLQASLAPIALISGVGLLLLSMVNRYHHALDRTRHLLKERPTIAEDQRAALEAALQMLYGRCRIMKNAILCVSSSIVCVGCLVFIAVVELLAQISMPWLKTSLLMFAIGLIVVAAVLFVVDIHYSLHAIRNELSQPDQQVG